jgi:hypothetical protein
MIDTGLTFQLVMKVAHIIASRPTKLDLYLAYAENYVQEQLDQLRPDQLLRIQGFDLKPLQLAQQIAMQLHLQKKNRLSSKSALFKTLDYQPELPFSHQAVSAVLHLLPLKIEKRRVGVGEEIRIGFIHDTLKNSFLIQAISEQLQSNVKSSLLTAHSLVDDIDMLR